MAKVCRRYNIFIKLTRYDMDDGWMIKVERKKPHTPYPGGVGCGIMVAGKGGGFHAVL